MKIVFETWAMRLTGAALWVLACTAGAAEITVYSAGAVKAALGEVVQHFEKDSGHRVQVEFAPVGSLLRRLSEGGRADVVVLTVDVMAEVERKAWTVPGTAHPVGNVGVGLAVREGVPLPDISTPDALKKTLLAARSITYVDPEKGTSGKHFVQVLKRLGIEDEMRSRTTLGDSGYVVEPVARGDIELGIQQITEILPVAGAKLVGPLPDPLQKITTYTVALGAQARDLAAAQSFMTYLRSAQSRKIFESKGFSVPQ
jgi:molybdate transport system substrate-binding protein